MRSGSALWAAVLAAAALGCVSSATPVAQPPVPQTDKAAAKHIAAGELKEFVAKIEKDGRGFYLTADEASKTFTPGAILPAGYEETLAPYRQKTEAGVVTYEFSKSEGAYGYYRVGIEVEAKTGAVVKCDVVGKKYWPPRRGPGDPQPATGN